MAKEDETKELLQKLLEGVYEQQQGIDVQAQSDSYLMAGDGQFLGKITANAFDNSSLLNEYGPYGSAYSATSIFNPYSTYGSEFGAWSPNNPYSSTPPKLVIQGREIGKVSKNQFVPNVIPTESFLYALKNDIQGLLTGSVTKSEVTVLRRQGDSFIVADDGTFLGKLNPNPHDTESIFSKYGPHGNRYSQTSIFNPYGPYGGKYGAYSPFNRYAEPPKVFLGGKFLAYLTVNNSKKPRVDPETIKEWALENVKKFS